MLFIYLALQEQMTSFEQENLGKYFAAKTDRSLSTNTNRLNERFNIKMKVKDKLYKLVF